MRNQQLNKLRENNYKRNCKKHKNLLVKIVLKLRPCNNKYNNNRPRCNKKNNNYKCKWHKWMLKQTFFQIQWVVVIIILTLRWHHRWWVMECNQEWWCSNQEWWCNNQECMANNLWCNNQECMDSNQWCSSQCMGSSQWCSNQECMDNNHNINNNKHPKHNITKTVINWNGVILIHMVVMVLHVMIVMQQFQLPTGSIIATHKKWIYANNVVLNTGYEKIKSLYQCLITNKLKIIYWVIKWNLFLEFFIWF